jgi:hypothetical protein
MAHLQRHTPNHHHVKVRHLTGNRKSCAASAVAAQELEVPSRTSAPPDASS